MPQCQPNLDAKLHQITAPPVTFFYTISASRKATKQARILNIELVSKLAQRAGTLIIEPGIQRRLESQNQQYRFYYVNRLGTRRKQSLLDHEITIKLNHYQSPLDYEVTTILYRKQLKQCYTHKGATHKQVMKSLSDYR